MAKLERKRFIVSMGSSGRDPREILDNQRRRPSWRGALATKPSSGGAPRPLDCFAALAMTVAGAVDNDPGAA
jgi:hypothetical protein